MHRVGLISEGTGVIREMLSDTLVGSAQLDLHPSTTSFLKDFKARPVPKVGLFLSSPQVVQISQAVDRLSMDQGWSRHAHVPVPPHAATNVPFDEWSAIRAGGRVAGNCCAKTLMRGGLRKVADAVIPRICKTHHMIGGKHLQRGTNRALVYLAFHMLAGPRVFALALIFEGDRLLARRDFEVIYQPAHGLVEDVVIASLIRLMNDTDFGEAAPPQSLFGRAMQDIRG